MITFDLQQNLPTPNLNHKDIFYLRQLWSYNFGIHDCVTEQGYMFMWHLPNVEHLKSPALIPSSAVFAWAQVPLSVIWIAAEAKTRTLHSLQC